MESRLKITLTLLILLVIIAAVSFFVIRPMISGIFLAADELRASRARLVRAEFAADEASRFQEELKNYEHLENSIKDALISQEDIVDLFVILERLARDLKLSYDVQLLTPSESLGSTDKVDLQIVLSGDFIQVERFISGLENLPFLNQVIRWQITKTGETPGASPEAKISTRANAGITVSVFVRNQVSEEKKIQESGT